ncbi:MAG: energy-coupling factor transporter transmembrane component T [Eubacteriales bacterium]|nr:energy-coupling factor transporter transmembrane component T [Eubacteriales bacterium]
MLKFRLDPRTKILLLVLVTAVVLGGVGGNHMQPFVYVLSVLPAAMLLSVGKVRKAMRGMLLILMAYTAQFLLMGKIHGISGFLLLFVTGIWSRLLPGMMMGQYVMETTTVSEFIAAFERMHVPLQLTVPLSVMFRFFPTVKEEFQAINAAMKMRDIRFGGGNMVKAIEYRIVPMLSCSARIGEELSAAALSRGLCGERKRSNVCRIGFGICDRICLVFGAVCVLYGTAAAIGVIS